MTRASATVADVTVRNAAAAASTNNNGNDNNNKNNNNNNNDNNNNNNNNNGSFTSSVDYKTNIISSFQQRMFNKSFRRCQKSKTAFHKQSSFSPSKQKQKIQNKTLICIFK